MTELEEVKRWIEQYRKKAFQKSLDWKNNPERQEMALEQIDMTTTALFWIEKARGEIEDKKGG